MQKIWPKISDFRLWQPGANDLKVTKKCFRELWDPFGAGRKFFGHPAPKRSIFWRDRNFCKSTFWPNFSGFRLWEACAASYWSGRHEIFSERALEPHWYGPKNFNHPHPKRADLGQQKFLPNPFWPFFGQKFFDLFFELVEGRSLGDQMLPEWPLLAEIA